MTSIVVRLAVAALGIAMLGGCMGIREHRGFVIDQELAQGIQVGVDNKESVARTLGRPTFTGQFGDNDWYYVSQDTKTVPFRSPRVTDQTVLHVRFDPAGNVASINRTDEALVVNINPVDDQTPTLGRERSFFDEIFGNIGVFNSGAMAPQQPTQ